MSIPRSIRGLFVALLGCLCGNGSGLATEQNIAVTVGKADEAFVVEATIEAPVALRTAWEVLVDFDHMTSILGNLTASKVTGRDGNTLIVRQEGIARYGLFSYGFQSEREIRLEPMTRILAKNLSGTVKRMESQTHLTHAEQGKGIQIKYRAEVVPDSFLAQMFGASFLRHEIEEQFRHLVTEMQRREAQTPSAPAEADKGN